MTRTALIFMGLIAFIAAAYVSCEAMNDPFVSLSGYPAHPQMPSLRKSAKF